MNVDLTLRNLPDETAAVLYEAVVNHRPQLIEILKRQFGSERTDVQLTDIIHRIESACTDAMISQDPVILARIIAFAVIGFESYVKAHQQALMLPETRSPGSRISSYAALVGAEARLVGGSEHSAPRS